MKMKKITLIALLYTSLLYIEEASACSYPEPKSTPEDCLSFREAIDRADYIIVTKLEEYLPDKKGRFRIMMTMRGDIPAGAMVKYDAWPLPPNATGGDCSTGMPLGELIVFMGEGYARDGEYYVPRHFSCGGKVSITDHEDRGFRTLHAITNRVLESKKASPTNGGPKQERLF